MDNICVFLSFYCTIFQNASSEGNNSNSRTEDVIHGTIHPPLPDEGKFVKVLLAGMPWDIYKEPTLQRLYYVNRETGERMWKPPRRDKPSSSEQVILLFKYGHDC